MLVFREFEKSKRTHKELVDSMLDIIQKRRKAMKFMAIACESRIALTSHLVETIDANVSLFSTFVYNLIIIF